MQTNKKPEHVTNLIVLPGVERIANLAAETACIGAVLADTTYYPMLAQIITHEDFTNEFNVYAWKACTVAYDEGAQLDAITVGDALVKLPKAREKFGADMDQIRQRLRDCIPYTPITENATAYALKVRESAIRIRAINTATAMDKAMRNTDTPLSDCLDIANQHWYTATQQHGATQTDMTSITTNFIKRVKTQERPQIVPTGFKDLDNNQNGGLLRGYAYMLVGNTGHGKTNFTLSMMRKIAMTQSGVGMASFHYEMSQPEVIKNFFTMHTGIYGYKFDDTSKLSERDMQELATAQQALEAWNLNIFADYEQNTVSYIRRQVRALQSQRDISIVVIDGLWKLAHIDASGTKHDVNNVLNYPSIMTDITNMAEQLNVAVWVLHQFNQGGVGDDAKPRLTDVEGRTSATRDAQVVYALKRNFAPNKPTELHRLKDRAQGVMSEPIYFDYLTSHMRYVTHGSIPAIGMTAEEVENVDF